MITFWRFLQERTKYIPGIELDDEKKLSFEEFILKRESARKKYERGTKRPFTNDPILNNCRFTNINRDHDKATKFLYKFLKNMSMKQRVMYALLFRASFSSMRLFKQLSGNIKKDIDTIREFDDPIYNKGYAPYQIFFKKGQGVKSFLIDDVLPVAEKYYKRFKQYKDVDLNDATAELGKIFRQEHGKNLTFLSTETVADLAHFYPKKINPNSRCPMNTGAIKCLKKMGVKDVDKLLSKLQRNKKLKRIGFNYKILEHALCEYGKYLDNWEIYKNRKVFKKYFGD